MSGICGIVRLDGGQVDFGDISVMTRQLDRRGPDGTRQWAEGSAALGHTLLATTPESLVEVLPLTDLASGCTITADVRLDNREELLATLGLEGESRVIGDGELILRAYLRWSEDCPKRLLGDFAFAIWDPRSQGLFCARDHMGMRQFNYCHVPGKAFLFATEAEAVVAAPHVPRRINEDRIADFLENLEGIDLVSTFFENVYRLPPAHALTLRRNDFALKSYWKLELPPSLQLATEEAYASAFLDVFTEAVRCRLRSAGPVGSMLSGGLDSSSVTAVAAAILESDGMGPLLTFSACGPDPNACAETSAVHSALGMPGLSPTLVRHDDPTLDWEGILGLTANCKEPFDAHMALIAAVYSAAHRSGIKTVLDAVSADITLGAGNRIGSLMRRGRILQAIREAKAAESFWGSSERVTIGLAKALWVAFVPSGLRALRREFNRKRLDRQLVAGRALVDPDFASRTSLATRRARFQRARTAVSPTSPDYRLHFLRHPHLVAARERYDRVASGVAIEARDPFMDIRLIRFCLSLPASQMLSRGWPKLVLRKAMTGLIPTEIAWRRGRWHLGPDFRRAVVRAWQSRSAGRQPDFEIVSSYASRWAINRARQPESPVDMETHFKLCVLSSWLRRNLGLAHVQR